MPASVRWSSRASATGRVGSSERSRSEDRRPVQLVGEDVGPEPPQVRVEAPGGCPASARGSGPGTERPCGPPSRGPATPRARGARRRSRRSKIRQRPDIRRWEWIVRPLSQRRNRCFPWVSIDLTGLRRASRATGRARAGAAGCRSAPAVCRPERAVAGPRSRGSCLPRACRSDDRGTVPARNPSFGLLEPFGPENPVAACNFALPRTNMCSIC